MLKVAFAAVLLTVFTIGSCRQGIQDASRALLHWNYSPIRDMRRTVAIPPQQRVMRAPEAGTVPVAGVELTYGLEGIELAERLGATLVNPVAATDSSIARGAFKFVKNCVPCHGRTLAGDGPVSQSFMPPPDLLAEATRNRADGYLYSYIRHGGAVMPSYGAQTTPEEAWNLVNYIRHMQKTSPR
uniref:Cytochrome c n=1 Tax=Eiseniibacteriota bacterium TaxID=2212470 RepID=A0A832I9W4_UNCEI